VSAVAPVADGIDPANSADVIAELRSSARAYLGDRVPMSVVRAVCESATGHPEDIWREIADLGWLGLGVPEQYGGAGAGMPAMTAVLEEMGYALFPGPYFPTVVLASSSILSSGDTDACTAILPRIVSGDAVVTLAFVEDSGSWDITGARCEATPSASGGYLLTGRKSFVLDGCIADVLLVTARTAQGISLFAVEAGAAGMTREPLQTLDLTRRQARVTCDRTPARLIGGEGEAASYLRVPLLLALVGLAAEQVGGAQACLDRSVRYAKDRYQFGRPIGSFQAVKHRCADMLVAVESARSAASCATRAAAAAADDLATVAHLAKAFCSDAFSEVAASNIQVHGGLGFTWEHDAHLYFRRAKSSEHLLGDPNHHREALIRTLGI
jgi:alkylation response protein AidB-like acyl-CoA dehydrogenase